MKEHIKVTIANTKLDIQAAKELINQRLFIPGGHQLNDEHDVRDQVAYVIARYSDNIIGSGRLMLNPQMNYSDGFGLALLNTLNNIGIPQSDTDNHLAIFYGLILEETYRGLGIGSQMYNLREELAIKAGKNIFAAKIRPDSWNIYNHRGYTDFGSDASDMQGQAVTRRWVYKVNK